MKVQLLAAASAGALTLILGGVAFAQTVDVNAAASLGVGNQSAQGNTVGGDGSAGGALSNRDNTTISGGTGNAGGDLANIDKTNSGTAASKGGVINTGDNASKGSVANSGTQVAASKGGVNNDGAYATKGGTNNSGTQVAASDGGVNNTGAYASKGGNTGTQVSASDGGVNNDGNNAAKGGVIVTGDSGVGGNSISKSNFDNGARTWNIYKVSTRQDLDSTVTGNRVGAGTTWSAASSTGAVSLTESGFAGIQTASNNTGLNSSNLAATAVSANANITFGSVH